VLDGIMGGGRHRANREVAARRSGISRTGDAMRLCYRRAMDRFPTIDRVWWDRLAIATAFAALVVGVASVSFARYDSGVRVTQGSGGIVVSEVNEHSQARQYGIRPGMVVTEMNGVRLIQLPEPRYGTQPSADPDTGEIVDSPIIGYEPAAPTPVAVDPTTLDWLLTTPVVSLTAIDPGFLQAGSPDIGYDATSIYDDGRNGINEAVPSLVLGISLMALAGWWLASGRAGENLRDLAVPLAVATATPFIVRPAAASWSPPLVLTASLLLTLSMIPLAVALLDRIGQPDERRLVRFAVAATSVLAALVGVSLVLSSFWNGQDTARWLLTGLVPLIPGLAAAGPIQNASGEPASISLRLLERTEYAVIGVTPMMALLSTNPPFLFPITLWLAVVLLAGRFTVRPLARLATRATLQRDLVVAATEAERARVAADIHNDALQELTLLVHRLDAAGDPEGADIARTVSDRLRAICGDLRLPILDDLGVGPALDWLVLRIERLAGGEVRLERQDGARPPADVELAFFRVAQEALANAVKHGRPPIVVRYQTSTAGASLSIDDAGPGIKPDASEGADRSGHFGLLNMQQRAEAIGAILDVRRWPAGGTHVALEWRAR
jgi:signal transduction histidine kinase